MLKVRVSIIFLSHILLDFQNVVLVMKRKECEGGDKNKKCIELLGQIRERIIL